jgi:hypothetical protein
MITVFRNTPPQNSKNLLTFWRQILPVFSTYRLEAAGSVILQNAAKCPPHCMVSHPSRWQIS